METKINRRKIIKKCIVVSIVIVLGSVAVVYKNWKEESKEIIAIMVGNMIASYEHIDRELDLAYFYDLDVYTTYEEMVNEIGKPNGAIGSGITIPYYAVGNQYVAIWFARDKDGMFTNIVKMELYTADTYIGEIPLKE